MSKKLYVGNLSIGATDDDLLELFSRYGAVTSASVVMDRNTGRSRGFGFVEMSDGGEVAIAATNGLPYLGRTLSVNEAQARDTRPSFGSGNYGGGGSGNRRS